MNLLPGTNLYSFFSKSVNISTKDSNDELAIEIECNGDPNTVATEPGIYALGCTARRTDLASGNVLYQQSGTLLSPFWYLV